MRGETIQSLDLGLAAQTEDIPNLFRGCERNGGSSSRNQFPPDRVHLKVCLTLLVPTRHPHRSSGTASMSLGAPK